MESTWASGALELLRHANSHIDRNTAFDKRIAFISIDNSVEITIRTFLSLPKTKSGIKANRDEIEGAKNSFTNMLSLLYKYASDKLTGIDESDIEHYHRIRNKLYHEGTGLSVDDQYLKAYRRIGEILLQNLFGVSIKPFQDEQASIEKLIFNWNKIQRILKIHMEEKGIYNAFAWETSYASGLFDKDEWGKLENLRVARNRIVHSEAIDKAEILKWVELSDILLKNLINRLK